MSKASLPPKIASPNLRNNSKDKLETAYDGLALREEKYVTPKGVKGKTTVFYRATPNQLRIDLSGKIEAATKAAKSHLESVLIKKWESTPKLQKLPLQTFLALYAVQEEGNIKKSSDKQVSANSFNKLNQERNWIPEKKLVRFVDSYNTEIPQKIPTKSPPPKEIVLPELPPGE